MVKWKVAQRLQLEGWTNANRLAAGAGLSYPVAWRIIKNEPLERIDVVTLEKLARALRVKNALRLLEHTRD